MSKPSLLSFCIIFFMLLSSKLISQTREAGLLLLNHNQIQYPKIGSNDGGVTSVWFVGNGDIQKSFSEGKAINANTGLGIIFKRRWQESLIQDIEFDLNINIASTADSITAQTNNQEITNKRDFGSYLLIPNNSKQSANFDFNVSFGNYENNKWAKFVSGLNFRFNASNSIWVYNNTPINLSAFSTRLGLFHEFMPDLIRHNETTSYSIKFGAAYSFRGLYGDLSSKQNETLRNKFLSTNNTRFNGLELFLGFRLKNLSAEIQIPILRNGISEVAGLTNTQFVTSIRFVGGFSLIFEKSDGSFDVQEKK